MNQLVAGMTKEDNKTFTENGMKMKKSSQDAIVDLFFAIGASRGQDILPLFQKAVKSDVDLAVRVALYARDVREGMGERQLFRDILHDFAIKDYKTAKRLIPIVPELGRWDDLFALIDTPLEHEALTFYAQALERGDGLAAKWAPRIKSSKTKWAVKLRDHMFGKPAKGKEASISRQYRELIVELTSVVEQQMSANDWSKINFSHVPSLASARYQSAFLRNDEARYRDYLSKLEKGDTSVKINAGAVYPYDVIKSLSKGESRAAEQQWKALPDWIGNDRAFIPMIDVSGSMGCHRLGSNLTVMDVAVSLGLYCAQRSKSAFKDTFLTFSESPTWINVSGLDLRNSVDKTRRANWGMNTNIEKAYHLILDVAKKNRVPQSDMPEFLIIFSDMQFDACTQGKNAVFSNMKETFKKAGYEMPKIVFWNLRDAGANTPVKFDKNGVALVSGFSPSMIKSVLSMDVEKFSPINIVLDTVMSDRYNW